MFEPELEVEIKVPKIPETEDEKQEFEAKRVIKGILDVNDLNTVHRKLTIKLTDIRSYGDYDGVYTVAYLTYAVILINIPYLQFQAIYETLTGKIAKKMSDFKFAMQPEKPKRRRKFDEDDE